MTNPKLLINQFTMAALCVVLGCSAQAELPEAKAREYVKRGVLVVDVRTVAEFNAKHLTNVTNIPLAEVKVKFPQVVTNKSEVVLLHCRSGRRSGAAESELRALGYTNVFNIGSYEQAQKILEGAAKE
jgi:phage shock protein E